MKRPSVKQALIAVLSVICAFLVVLSYSSLSTISTLNDNTQQIGGFWVKRLVTARDIKGNFSDLKLAYARYLLEASPEKQAAEAKLVDDANSAVKSAIDEYVKGVRTTRGRELIDQVNAELKKYGELAEHMVQLQDSGKGAEAVSLFRENMEPQSDLVSQQVADLVAFILSQTEAYVAASGTAASDAFIVTAIIATLAVLVALAGTIFAVLGIANPIRRIASAMKILSDGDLQSEIPFAGRADEIGAMAAAVEVFRQNAINVLRLEQEASASRSQSEAARAAAQERAEREAQQLRFATTTLGDGLRRLAGGDVSFQLAEPFAAEYEQLREDFNTSLKQLGRAIGAVLQTVHSIDNGTREIASGAQDLSKRTEQQAASLEETAAALDEITTNVATASKRTDEARNVAHEANVSAGLAEINTAVNQMDQSTQQNAATVEQSTAAAASLSSEASRLRDLVNQFRLDDAPSRSATMRSDVRHRAA